MPTYDYGCRECGAVTEVIHSMLEDGPSTCELCGGKLRRVLYPTGIIFKGSGFYRNDSRAKTPEKSGTSGTDSAKSDSSTAGAGSTGSAKPAGGGGDGGSGGSSDAKGSGSEAS